MQNPNPEPAHFRVPQVPQPQVQDRHNAPFRVEDKLEPPKLQQASKIPGLLLYILAGALICILLFNGATIMFYRHMISKSKTDDRLNQALSYFKSMQERVPVIGKYLYLQEKAEILALNRNWTLLRNTTQRAVDSFYGKSFVIWFYKALAQEYLNQTEQSGNSILQSIYLESTPQGWMFYGTRSHLAESSVEVETRKDRRIYI